MYSKIFKKTSKYGYILFHVLMYLSSKLFAGVCKTTSGGTVDAPCVFPFVYREVKYTGKYLFTCSAKNSQFMDSQSTL